MKAEMAFGKSALQTRDELAPKDATQHFDGKEEAVTRVDPAGVVEGEAAGRNDAVDMRMMFQLLVPGMEHAEEADVGAEMLGITSDFEQRFSAGVEQQTVDDLLILQGQGCQEVREREDQVHVVRRQEFPAALLEPTIPGVSLALGAVPVSARVVRDGAIPAARTLIPMPAEGGGTAALDGR